MELLINMVHKIYAFTIFLLLFLLFIPATRGFTAEKSNNTRYVSDFLIINLRDNMESPYSIVGRIKTDDALKILGEKGKYYKVKTSENKVGWVAKQFTTAATPKSFIIKDLKERIAQLESKDEFGLKKVLDQKETALAELKKAEENIAVLNKKITELETLNTSLHTIDPQKYNTTLTHFKELKKSYIEQQNLLATVQKDNRTYQFKSKIYWFLAGAFVLFFGILLGKIPSKRQKKFSF